MADLKYLLVGFACAAAITGAMPARAEPVTLTAWTIDFENQYMFTFAKQFEKLHPDIKVNVKHVQFPDINNDLARASVTGDVPDVSYIDNPYIDLFATRGLLLDLAPMIHDSKVIDMSKFYAGPRAAAQYGDKVFGVPRGANTLAVYYNADMFRSHGLDPDKPPQTWDELYADAKKLTDATKNVYGLAFSAVASEEGTFQFLPWAQMAGGDYNKVNTPGSVKALQFWQKLLDEKLASPDTLVRGQYDSTATFNAGNAAMAISGPWELPRMSTDAKFDYRVALLPTLSPGSLRVSALGEGDNVIMAKSKHPKEAFAFVEFLTQQMPLVWNQCGFLPASQVTVADPKWSADYALFLEALKTARVRGPSPQWPAISQAIQAAIQAALTHQSTAQAALDGAQGQIDALASQ